MEKNGIVGSQRFFGNAERRSANVNPLSCLTKEIFDSESYLTKSIAWGRGRRRRSGLA